MVLKGGLSLMSEVPLYCIEYRRLNYPGIRPLPYEVGDDSVQLLHRNEKRFRGGLVFNAHRWLYHSTLGSRVKRKKRGVHLALERVANSQFPLKAVVFKVNIVS